MLTPVTYTMLYFNFSSIKLEGGIKTMNQMNLIIYIHHICIIYVCVYRFIGIT